MATRQQVLESMRRLDRVKQELGIRPKMDVIQCNGVSNYTFDLRSLNTNLVAKVRKR